MPPTPLAECTHTAYVRMLYCCWHYNYQFLTYVTHTHANSYVYVMEDSQRLTRLCFVYNVTANCTGMHVGSPRYTLAYAATNWTSSFPATSSAVSSAQCHHALRRQAALHYSCTTVPSPSIDWLQTVLISPDGQWHKQQAFLPLLLNISGSVTNISWRIY
jgi:hypothetical protein